MSGINLAAQPTPDHMTLLFKCSKSTTLLSVLPDQDFSEIKAILLAALKSRDIVTLPGSTLPLPTDPDEIEFSKLVDRRDASKGWLLLDAKDQDAGSVKSGKQKNTGKPPTLTNTPSSAGLSEGSWIAYRLKHSRKETSDAEVPDIEMEDDQGWDVVLPNYDDDIENVEP